MYDHIETGKFKVMGLGALFLNRSLVGFLSRMQLDG